MNPQLLTPLAHCRNFTQLAQVLVESDLYNHDFTGCMIAEIGEDGRIREAGRYGITGPGPSAEAVPLWDEGLIAKALKKSSPTVIENTLEAAKERRLTPSSDIDDVLSLNGFQTIVTIPLRSFGLLNGVVGLASVEPLDGPLEMNYDYEDLQSLLTLATRSVAYSEPTAPKDLSPVLTTRDRAILKLLATGRTNKEISKKLNLSLSTVKLSVSNILAKLGVSGRQAAGEKAKELGIAAEDS